jgi:hypothetical protein
MSPSGRKTEANGYPPLSSNKSQMSRITSWPGRRPIRGPDGTDSCDSERAAMIDQYGPQGDHRCDRSTPGHGFPSRLRTDALRTAAAGEEPRTAYALVRSSFTSAICSLSAVDSAWRAISRAPSLPPRPRAAARFSCGGHPSGSAGTAARGRDARLGARAVCMTRSAPVQELWRGVTS